MYGIVRRKQLWLQERARREEIATHRKSRRKECSYRRAGNANRRFWRTNWRTFSRGKGLRATIIPSSDPLYGWRWEYGKGEVTPGTEKTFATAPQGNGHRW